MYTLVLSVKDFLDGYECRAWLSSKSETFMGNDVVQAPLSYVHADEIAGDDPQERLLNAANLLMQRLVEECDSYFPESIIKD